MTQSVDPFETHPDRPYQHNDQYPPVQLSFFVGGKDQFVVRGANATDVSALMEELDEKMGAILESLNNIRAKAVMLSNDPTPVAQPRPPRPAPETHSGEMLCECGAPRVYVQDRSKPPTWAALYCPKPKGQQCFPKSKPTAIRNITP